MRLNISPYPLPKIFTLFSLITLCAACPKNESGTKSGAKAPLEKAQVVNLYSHRHYEADKILFERFEEKTGIEVNVVKAKADELLQRLKSEAERSPADIFMTSDAARLVLAKKAGLLQAIESQTLESRIPSHLRDPQMQWFGLSKRARVIAYAKDKIDPQTLGTYEDLGNHSYQGKLLIRSSANIYNQSLLASLIAHHGEEKAKNWARSTLKNLARTPKGSDRDQMKAVAAGVADLAVVNTYYLGLLLNSKVDAEREVGQQMGIFFPNQKGRGTHINISGAGLTKYAPNRENAIKLLEFLVSDEAQKTFAEANYEYPVVNTIEPTALLKSWGSFKEDRLSLAKLGEFNAAAVKTFDAVGWR